MVEQHLSSTSTPRSPTTPMPENNAVYSVFWILLFGLHYSCSRHAVRLGF
ncbi:MAG: hypothetical protein DSM106950_13695 [Stigonema ocellatum SAG 48.90 = DSM 106950]|nr:hypothetical protein [Stigonema ocellatum SAG 48.90 = DSM 106950]